MDKLQQLPPVRWSLAHPRLVAWIVLALGMVILLIIEARDIGLQAGNWVALIVATVLVAGLCIWIVSWEDADETADSGVTASTSRAAQSSDDGNSGDTGSVEESG
jgi:K+ transporter